MPERNNLRNTASRMSLKDLINIKEWQKIQDNFSAVTGIAIRTLDSKGDPVTLPSTEPRLCTELLNGSKEKDLLCGRCLPTFMGGEAVVDKNLSFVCTAGLHNFIVPIRLNEGVVLGYIILGPVVLVMRKQKQDYQQAAEELNVNLEDFWSAIIEIKTISLHGIKSLVQLIEDICECTINLAYKNKVKERGVMMELDSSRLSRLFNVFLDAAFEVSQADIGSVMLFDDSQENLTIRASKGIPDGIARDAKVRLGEGVSGIAVKEERPLLIDENIKDNRIIPYLKRPNISSSMVIPIKIEGKVVGVMNLGALETSTVRFNRDNIAVMHKLIDLVSVAISPAK